MSKSRYSTPVLLSMAIEIEKSAESFYKTLAKKFPEHEKMFESLEAEEKYHAKTYTNLLGQKRLDEVQVTKEERELSEKNIKVLEDTKVVGSLREGERRANESKDLKSAISAAIQMEKDTLLFYYNLAMGLGKKERQEVYKIIQVEHNHLYKVQNLI